MKNYRSSTLFLAVWIIGLGLFSIFQFFALGLMYECGNCGASAILQHAIVFGFLGSVMGILQWLILRMLIKVPASFILATLIGYGLGFIAFSFFLSPPFLFLPGLLMGFGQAFILRSELRFPIIWPLIASFAVPLPFYVDPWSVWMIPLHFASPLISGVALVWLTGNWDKNAKAKNK